MKRLALAALAVLVLVPCLRADGEDAGERKTMLTRDEVAAVKHKLTAVLAALGAPPSGYAKEKENYSLPTNFNKREDGGYGSVYASADYTFSAKAVKDAQKSQKDFAMDYQRKIAEAQAKGDYETMMKLSQEMQQKSGQMQVQAIDAEQSGKKPIEVRITLNSNPETVIDPDAVVVDKPGVIGLKAKEGDDSENQERVSVFFDPVSLKDTKSISRVSMPWPEKGVSKKTAVLTVGVELKGPASEVEAWAKAVKTASVLAVIDPLRK